MFWFFYCCKELNLQKKVPFNTKDYCKWHQFQTNEVGAAHFDLGNLFMDLKDIYSILLQSSKVVVSKKSP